MAYQKTLFCIVMEEDLWPSHQNLMRFTKCLFQTLLLFYLID